MMRVGDWIKVLIYYYGLTPGQIYTIKALASNGFYVSYTDRLGANMDIFFADASHGVTWEMYGLSGSAGSNYAPIPVPANSTQLWGGGLSTDIGVKTLPKGQTQASYGGEKQCLHDWKTYNSGWQTYDYCTKCDIKRDTSNDRPADDGSWSDDGFWHANRTIVSYDSGGALNLTTMKCSCHSNGRQRSGIYSDGTCHNCGLFV